MKLPEPCLCGDPYCRRCFPEQAEWLQEKDEDEAYEIMRQREIDDERE